MVVLQRGSYFEVHSPAKLNLHLEILHRRSDGFHELETLMVALSLRDVLTLIPRSDDSLLLHCRWAPGLASQCGDSLGDLPPTESNIVYRALKLLRETAGIQAGAEVFLHKRVPSQAGLGGASSNAAAALLAANVAWKLGWSIEQLAGVAGRLGSDIPFFFTEGAAVCRGRGEQVESLGRTPPLHVVTVRPPEGLSTPLVYQHCRPADAPVGVEGIANALRRGDAVAVGRLLHNRLQEPAESLSPWIRRLKQAFAAEDCLGHRLTGSGSSYFGLFRSAVQARRAASRFRAAGLGYAFAGTTGAAA